MIFCTVKTKTPKSYMDEAGLLTDLRVSAVLQINGPGAAS